MPLTLSTPSERTIEIRRAFAAPRALLWRAYTDPALVPRWLTGPDGHTMPVCEMDVRAGGAFRWVWSLPDGTQMPASGTYLAVEPGARLVNSESFDTIEGAECQVETRFEDSEDGSGLVQIITYPSQMIRDAVLASPMEHGLEASFARLDGLIAEGLT